MPDSNQPIGPAAPSQLKPAALPSEASAAELRCKVPLDPDEIMRAALPAQFEELLGQQRAMAAVRLAIGIDAPGYNVFVSGLRTRHERESILSLLREKAATMPTPGDWVYVHNFLSPEAPVAIYLTPGQGRELKTRMAELVNFVLDQLPKAFRREDFDQERTALREKYNKRAQELFSGLEQRARERGFAIQSTPTGQILFIPLVGGKMPESPEALAQAMNAMTEAERERLARVQAELQDDLGSLIMRQQEMMRELIEDIRGIERAFAARLITPSIEGLKGHFENPAVDRYLDAVAEHMLSHLDRFREARGEQPPGLPASLAGPDDGARWIEYQVNVMVDNSATKGAPVISEDAPTHRNLFGTIERWVDPFGRAGTNFTRIIGGSYIKSHNGFLVLDIEDAAVEPGVWQAIKRSLKSGRLTIETYEPLPFFSLSGLKPEPIEIHNKLVVLGGPYLYNLLYFYDNDFADLFKVKAEMRPVVDADKAAAIHYAARVGSIARREKLGEFEADAICRIVEHGMRVAGDRSRVSAMLEGIDDVTREAAYFARNDSATRVSAAHVERALNERILRLNWIEEEIRRLIAKGTLIVHVDGRSVGQVNGLAVLDVGGYAFGRPSRVTATVALGQAGIVNIEREARLSGSTHDKGIMILSGFLRARFAQQHPIAMTASICFEQSYSGIDGDSASSTELYALLSALSGVPLRQDLAVTGSVDQYGTVQAIGGVNEKIEGFYRVCKAIGLTGAQGVLIPKVNLANLVPDSETLAAVERGSFHIYPVETIDQGIELLTGVRAGTVDEPGTINYLVDQRLRWMAEQLRTRPGETRVVEQVPVEQPRPKPPAPPEPPR
jgi:predicted ATP-dependent protease